jgi:hypothetical protein
MVLAAGKRIGEEPPANGNDMGVVGLEDIVTRSPGSNGFLAFLILIGRPSPCAARFLAFGFAPTNGGMAV